MSLVRFVRTTSFASLALMTVAIAGTSVAQSPSKPDAKSEGSAPAAAPAARSTGIPQRDTLLKIQRPVSLPETEQKLEEVFDHIKTETGANFEVMWKTDREDGWAKDAPITMTGIDKLPAITVIEKVLQKLSAELGEETNWQMTEYGSIQIGNKKRLNAFKRIEIYDINDLLFIMPIYNNAPEIDLNQVLQSKGGGGGSSPFNQNKGNQNNRDNERPKEERGNDVINLIQSLAETSQWVEQGGDGGTMKYYQGNIIVNAPDYMHRAVAGYTWWPQTKAPITPKRYVTLSQDASVSKLNGFAVQPVSAGAGGTAPGGVGPGR